MRCVIDVRMAHTADLDVATLSAARALLDAVFRDEMTDHDWEHALGGIHAFVWDGGELAGHASVVPASALAPWACAAGGLRRGRRCASRRARAGIRRGDDGSAGASGTRGYAGRHRRGRQLLRNPRLEAMARIDFGAHTPGSCAPRRRTDLSTCCPSLRRWICMYGELICDWRDGDVW
jgi:aminoglycoside 2'-N-acetyltransferase I